MSEISQTSAQRFRALVRSIANGKRDATIARLAAGGDVSTVFKRNKVEDPVDRAAVMIDFIKKLRGFAKDEGCAPCAERVTDDIVGLAVKGLLRERPGSALRTESGLREAAYTLYSTLLKAMEIDTSRIPRLVLQMRSRFCRDCLLATSDAAYDRVVRAALELGASP